MKSSLFRAGLISTLLAVLSLSPRPAGAATSCSQAPNVKYYGGPIVSNPQVVVVFWSANVGATIQASMAPFYTALVTSSYVDWLAEYNTAGITAQNGQPGTSQGISRGSVAGPYTIPPSVCPGDTASCALTDAQIQAEIGAQIAAGRLPGPSLGCDGLNHTIYAIHFPASITISFAGNKSCQSFCYYHGDGTANGKPFAYTVNPDVTTGTCAGGCGSSPTAINNQTSVSSAALIAAITDPQINEANTLGPPAGWYDPNCGEIPGICNLMQTTITVGSQTWTVQQQWSVRAAACGSGPSPLPTICPESTTTAGCRSCTCADDNQGGPGQIGCGGATPICDPALGRPPRGQCSASGTGGAGGSGGASGAGGAGGGTAGASGGSAGGGSGGGVGASGGSGGAGATGGGATGATGGSGGATGGSVGASGGSGGASGGSGGAGGSTVGGRGGATGGSAGGSSGAGGAGGHADGTEGGACYGNGTCNAGLTCLSHLCVTAPKSSGGCGCALGGPRDARALALVAMALGFVVMRSRRRRHRR